MLLCLNLRSCYCCQVNRAAGCFSTSITSHGSSGRVVLGDLRESRFTEGPKAQRLPADSHTLCSKQGAEFLCITEKQSWKGLLCLLSASSELAFRLERGTDHLFQHVSQDVGKLGSSNNEHMLPAPPEAW